MLLFDIGFLELQGMAIVILFGLLFYVLTELRMLKKEIRAKQPASASNSLLPIQAYERITVLTERMSLKNIVPRMHSTVLTVAELQAGMVETISNEYEHNITQQIYISPEVWKAVIKMKEQNIFIINQLASGLQPGANAIELSKRLLEYASNDNAELSAIVLDAIQYEVKRLVG